MVQNAFLFFFFCKICLWGKINDFFSENFSCEIYQCFQKKNFSSKKEETSKKIALGSIFHFRTKESDEHQNSKNSHFEKHFSLFFSLFFQNLV